ncbi:cupin-like domain-containing protein [Hyphomonas sp.]|uniref:cupin-like domain-containing protein n=1 Tax=Hyphomonas sp. TaxID=87 RepID=UPI0039191D01
MTELTKMETGDAGAALFRSLPPLPRRRGVTREIFRAEILPAGEPVVLEGVVADWPAVAAAREGTRSLAAYLASFDSGRPAETIFAPPEVDGRFFYTDDLKGLNFVRQPERIRDVLGGLAALEADDRPPSVYLQSLPIADHLPGFLAGHPLPHVPEGVQPRIWIGNRLSVQTHFDLFENIACVVAGRRRFTLFPPDQLANLYPGPFEFTLSGPPVSLVRPEAWDRDAFPRFAEALGAGRSAELGPGDAVFIPYAWWHHVESLARFNVLVNYWWSETEAIGGSPFDAMLHGLLALRSLPPRQRAVWKGFFDHYVFGMNGDPVAHLPTEVQGALGAHTPAQQRRLRHALLASLAAGLGLAPPPAD